MRAELPHRIVRASAGTGKTHRLASRYVSLLFAGAAPETILAATFTRKAAGEILGRVLLRLARAACDSREAKTLGSEIGRPGLRSATCLDLLVELCASLHRVSISTLDAFFYRLVCMLRFDLGIVAKPRMTTVGDPMERGRRQEALEVTLEGLAREGWSELLALVNRLHRDTARRSVAQSIDSLLVELYEVWGQAPEREIWTRLELPADVGHEELQAAVSELRRVARGSGPGAIRDALLANLDQAARSAWSELLERGLTAKLAQTPPEETYARRPIPDGWLEPLAVLVARARRGVLESLHRQTEATFELLRAFDSTYRAARREAGVLLFTDLPIELRRRLSVDNPEILADLYYRLDGKVSHLLLDEFQDTSLEQWSILRPMAEEILAWGDGSHTFFCVGDPKQAIYGWRGGCSDLFDQLEADLSLESSAEEQLDHCYRCSQVVLDVVNRVFSTLADAPSLEDHRAAATRWTDGFEEHTAARAHSGYVELRNSDDRDAHEEWVARELALLQGRVPHHSIAVLVQTNDQVGQTLEALRKAGLRASGEGGNRVDDDAVIAAVQAALQLADHPGDTVAAHHVARSPLGVILGLSGEEPEAVRRVSRGIRRSWHEMGPSGLLAEWVASLLPFCDPRNARRLSQALELAERFEEAGVQRPGELARFLSQARVEDTETQSLRVMTIHKAKGLEFDSVVLSELDRRLLRTQGAMVMMSRESPLAPVEAVYRSAGRVVREASPQLQEAFAQEQERRLRDDISALYVAMTRARSGLFLWTRPAETSRRRTAAPLSFASLLRQTLCPQATRRSLEASSERLFEHGDAALLERSIDTGPGDLPQEALSFEAPVMEGAASEEGLAPRVRLATVEEATRTDSVRLSEIWSESRQVLNRRRERLLQKLDAWQNPPATQDEIQDDPVLARLLEASPIAALMASALVRANTKTVWRDRPFVDLGGETPLRGRFERLWLQRDAEGPQRAAVVGTLHGGSDGPSSEGVARAMALLLRAAAARVLETPLQQVDAMVALLDQGVWVSATPT